MSSERVPAPAGNAGITTVWAGATDSGMKSDPNGTEPRRSEDRMARPSRPDVTDTRMAKRATPGTRRSMATERVLRAATTMPREDGVSIGPLGP